ncbi:glycosyltransferase [Hydrogenophaga sp. 5NK40-0174]|uniref:glycosyltransferase n=1 Tax=Hydrogenophaga sp. 5NK40-0174 TaxID=3127649 RepID=UPI0031072A39
MHGPSDQHYVLITVGTFGDVFPFMRIAKMLTRMGRRATLITNAYHSRLLEGSGIEYIGIGTDEDYRRFITDPDLWHPSRGFESVMRDYKEQLLQMVEAIRQATEDGPAMALAYPFAVPAAMMAEELGHIEKVASVYLSPSTLRTCHHPMRIGDHIVPKWVPVVWRKALWRLIETRKVDPTGVQRVDAVRKILQLPPMASSFLTHIESAPDFTVTLFPQWFAPTMPDWPKPLVSGDFQLRPPDEDIALPDRLRSFLSSGSEPLVFCSGSGVVHPKAKHMFKCAVQATKTLGARAIFLTQERAQVPDDLPANIHWESYASLSALLPRCKAIIHHGGVGTTAEALRAATPQLVTAFGWDQYDNGSRAAEQGAGLVMSAHKLTPRNLTQAIGKLLSSQDMPTNCVIASRHFDKQQPTEALCVNIERMFNTS